MGREGAADGPGWDPAEALRALGMRATPQRRAILDVFRGGQSEHLSAEEIHARASAKVEGIGRGTVYATLADLSEVGILASVGGQDPVRYETNVGRHHHFRCRLCLRLFDVDVAAPGTRKLTEQGYTVESVAVVVDGVCQECEDFGRGLQEGTAQVAQTRQLTEDAISGLSCVHHETSVGPLVMAASSDGVARIAFAHHADFAALHDRARSRRGGRAGRERVDHLAGSIDQFLAGSREAMSDGIDWGLVGERFRAPLELVRDIAWGDHLSYHKLPDSPFSAHDFGCALGMNPIPFLAPCHRLTRGGSPLGAYVGGLGVRDALTELETR